MSKQTLTLQEAKNEAESKWKTAVGKLGNANDAFNWAEEARREANVEAESAWLTWAKSCIDLGEDLGVVADSGRQATEERSAKSFIARSTSRRLMTPTSLPCRTTGRRRIL